MNENFNIFDGGFAGDKKCTKCGESVMEVEEFSTGKLIYECTACDHKEEVEIEEKGTEDINNWMDNK